MPAERAGPAGPPGVAIGPALAAGMAVPALIGAFLLLTSVMHPLTELKLYDGKRVLAIGLFILLAVLVLAVPALQRAIGSAWRATPRAVPLVLASVLLLGLVSALRLAHPAYAMVEVAQMTLWAGLVVVVAAARSVAGRWFERVALIAVGLLGLGVFLQEVAGLAAYTALGEQFQYREALIRFVHPRYYNQVQTWTLPVLAALPLAFPERARSLRVAASVLIGFQWYLLLMTGARGSIVALVAALLLVAAWLPAARRHWWKPHLAGLLIGVAIYAAALAVVSSAGKQVQPGGTFFEQSVGRPVLHTTGRTLLWRESVRDIQAHPWLGSGPMHYACEPQGYVAAHPHNFALQIAGEWGLPAAALLGGLIAWLLLRAALNSRRRPPAEHDPGGALRAMLLAGVVAAAAHLQVSGLLIGPASQVSGLLISGWLLAVLLIPRPESDAAPRWPGAALGGLLLALGLALGAFIRSELPHLAERTAYALEEFGPSAPRFWTDGRACLYTWPSEPGADAPSG